MTNAAVRRVLWAMLAVLLLSLSACSSSAAPMTYDTGAGLTITMREGMEPFDAEGITMAVADSRCMMTAVRHDYSTYSDMGADMTAVTEEEYVLLLEELGRLEQEFSYDAAGNYHTTYTAHVDGEDYFYYGIIHKGSDAFWLVTFTCEAGLSEEYIPLFIEWSRSIEA